MLTIFTTCRSFEEEQFAIAQTNALKSWTLLQPKPQIIVMGDEPGTRDIVKELDIEHVRNIKRSVWGGPRMDDMIDLAERLASHSIMLFMSSDLIVSQELANIGYYFAQLAPPTQFLVGVEKWEQKIHTLIDFSQKDWFDKLKPGMQPAPGGDLFMFPKGFFGQAMPPFIVGRAVVDFWMYHYARQKHCLYNATNRVTVIHVAHGHSHLSGTFGAYEVADHSTWQDWYTKHPEFQINIMLAGETLHSFTGHAKPISRLVSTLQEANYIMAPIVKQQNLEI